MTTFRGLGFRYDTRTARIRDFYVDKDGTRRWMDTHEPCPDQILKGNADLVPAEHATYKPEDKL